MYSPPAWLTLCGRRSSRTRVSWRDGCGDVAEVWDSRLLDAWLKAAAWVAQRRIEPCLEPGLELVARGRLTESAVSVGLCVTSFNRLWQLRRALPLNLLHSWVHRKWVKVHVVDFGSTDGSLDFLLRRCRAAIDAGLLRVYLAKGLPYWHASTAKNTAHAVASEDILVNVDGDNLVGPGFAADVARQFTQEGYTVLQYEGGEGTCGRIACFRRDFHMLRGYDEDAYPMGAQDTDLVGRLKRLPGAQYRRISSSVFSQAIPNSQETKVCMCDPGYGGLRWGRMDTLNKQIFQWRRSLGQLQRNLEKPDIGVPAWRVESDA